MKQNMYILQQNKNQLQQNLQGQINQINQKLKELA